MIILIIIIDKKNGNTLLNDLRICLPEDSAVETISVVTRWLLNQQQQQHQQSEVSCDTCDNNDDDDTYYHKYKFHNRLSIYTPFNPNAEMYRGGYIGTDFLNAIRQSNIEFLELYGLDCSHEEFTDLLNVLSEKLQIQQQRQQGQQEQY